MISLSVHPDTIFAGQPNDVSLRLNNDGSETYTGITLTLRLPPQVLTMRGDIRLSVDRLDSHGQYDHRLRLKAMQPGLHQMVVEGFSCRGPAGEIIRRPEQTLRLTAKAPAVAGALKGPQTSNLTPSQRQRLEGELTRLQTQYDTYTRRLTALDTDIGRTLGSLEKQVQAERRADVEAERQQILDQMQRVEMQLQSPSEAVSTGDTKRAVLSLSDIDEVEKQRESLLLLQKRAKDNLLKLELKEAEWVDPRTVPPDITIAKRLWEDKLADIIERLASLS